MNRNNLKLIGLLSIVAVLMSLLAIGSIMAGPSAVDPSTAADKGTITLTGGVKNQSIQWYSLSGTGDTVTIQVDDEDGDLANSLPNVWDAVRDPKGISVNTTETAGKADLKALTDDRFLTSKNPLSAATTPVLQELQSGTVAPLLVSSNADGVVSTFQLSDPDQGQEDPIADVLAVATTSLTAGVTNATIAIRTTPSANPFAAAGTTEVDGATRLRVTFAEASGSGITTGSSVTITGRIVNSLFQPMNITTNTFTGDGTTTVFTLSLAPEDRDGNHVLNDSDVSVVTTGSAVVIGSYAVDHAAKTVTFGTAPGIGASGHISVAYVTTVTSTNDVDDAVTYDSNQTAIIPGVTSTGASTDNDAGVTFTRLFLSHSPDNSTGDFLTSDLWKSVKTVVGGYGGGGAAVRSIRIQETKTMVVKYTYEAADKIKAKLSIMTTAGGTAVTPDLTETGNTTNKFTANLIGTSDAAYHGKAVTGGTGLLVANAAKLTFTYSDGNPTTNVDVEEAWVDTKAPKISIGTTGIADKASTSTAEPTIAVRVDEELITAVAAAGIPLSSISIFLMKPGETVGTDVTANTNTKILEDRTKPRDSSLAWDIEHKIKAASTTVPNAEGTYKYWVGVNDSVFNANFGTGSSAVTGAACKVGGEGATCNAPTVPPKSPYSFVLDTKAPAISTGDTGAELNKAGEVIGKNSARKALAVTFDLGTGGSVLDETTVAGADFTVDGVAALKATVGKQTAADKSARKQLVLLEMAVDVVPDKSPKVVVAGSINDKAGNSATSGTITATDKLAPSITVVVGGGARATSNNKVTITATVDEASDVTGTATYLVADVLDGTLVQGPATDTKTLSFKETSAFSGVWEATVDTDDISRSGSLIASGLLNVVVTATDRSVNQNFATGGKTDPDDTKSLDSLDAKAVVFEFDNLLNAGKNTTTATIFKISPVQTVGGVKTESDSPFVEINFDDEGKEYNIAHTGGTLSTDFKADSLSAVTITKAILTNPDASTADITAQLGVKDSNSYVWGALALAKGKYKLTVNATDALGNNSVTAPTAPGGTTTATNFVFDFEVVERSMYLVKLSPGWNLVSLPGEPKSNDINTVLGSAEGIVHVLTYDRSEAVPWLQSTRTGTVAFNEGVAAGTIGVLEKIDAKHAYWIRANGFVDLKVDIPAAALLGQFPPTTGVVEGWNLIPILDIRLPAFDTLSSADAYFTGLKWSAALTWDPLTANFEKVVPGPANSIKVGRGYWVWFQAAGTIVP
jgi:hypothetical protein